VIKCMFCYVFRESNMSILLLQRRQTAATSHVKSRSRYLNYLSHLISDVLGKAESFYRREKKTNRTGGYMYKKEKVISEVEEKKNEESRQRQSLIETHKTRKEKNLKNKQTRLQDQSIWRPQRDDIPTR
jgi:hypothetical protein